MEFLCQRCGKTLEIDESLLNIDCSSLEKGDLDFERIIKPQNPALFGKQSKFKQSHASVSSSFIDRPKPSLNYHYRNQSYESLLDLPNAKKEKEQVMETPVPKLKQMRATKGTSSTPGTSPTTQPLSISSENGVRKLTDSTETMLASLSVGQRAAASFQKPLSQSYIGGSTRLKYIRQPPSEPHHDTAAQDEDGVGVPLGLPSDDFIISKLFQVGMEQSGVDLPLCNECAKAMIAEIDEELSILETQNLSYSAFLDQLEQREKKWEVSYDDLQAEITKMEAEEQELRRQLVELDAQRARQQAESEYLQGEASRLASYETRYWLHFNELHSSLSSALGLLEERDACRVQTATATDTLERLRRTDTINDAFHVWHDGHFGTINSFRLGRLASQPVDWNEVNAAWGMATQLLACMARKIQFNFSSYRLVPMGSLSKMERTDSNSTYELFGSSDISLGRLFWYRRFDNGMVAFLMCLKEIGDWAESRDKTFKMPYRIDKDKVGDMSIKIQFNNEETWTKSLKYMLTNIKWLLAWIVKADAQGLLKPK